MLKTYTVSSAISEARSWEGAFSEARPDTASVDVSEASRRESMASRSISEWNWSETSRGDEKISPGTCSMAEEVAKVGGIIDAIAFYEVFEEKLL